MPDRISEHVVAVGVATIVAIAIAGTVTPTQLTRFRELDRRRVPGWTA